TPTAFVEFSRQGALSPDSRCKAFSDSAAGSTRGAVLWTSVRAGAYSTVTDLARLRGLSMSRPRARAVW
ncbi:beta-ketoacyl synthase N-terminal-like domain-containing protein, partial [Streptomyces mutabilis]|uniref:beta-ketoacyl synthase N-terminal-like domain-containing protein n=1 Tax=Streptomyces mutabilis TaxID=67332 RepID=UPI00341F9422